MHVPYSFYESAEMKRKMGPCWYKQPGCHCQPLFDITLDHIVIDELHLMLLVMDRLEQGLILAVVDWDKVYFLVLHLTTFTALHYKAMQIKYTQEWYI